MLVINCNRPVATEALIEAAWEQFPPPDPRASLHSYVSNLRKLLAGIGVDSRTALASAPPGYRLSVPENDCDIGRFALGKTAGVQAAAAGKFEQACQHHTALAEADNDIVLDNANVSRHHAVIIDTGTSFVISDLRSANGVDVRGERIRASVTLADGDRIRICDHEFVLEMQAPGA